MRKVLILSTHIAPEKGFGGPSVSIRRFIEILKEREISYCALSTGSKRTKVKLNDSVESVFKYLGSGKNGLSLILTLHVFHQIIKTNVVIINGLTTWPNLIGIFLGIVLGKNLVIFPRGALESGRTDDWNIYKKFIYKFQIALLEMGIRRDRILIVSATFSEQGKNILKTKHDLIIPNIMLKKSEHVNSRAVDILFVGRFSSEKGVDRLENLLLSFGGKYTIMLVIAGANLSTKRQIETKYGRINKLIVKYDVEHHELDGIYQQSKLLFFPSYKENFGNVLIEAVNNGVLPIVYENTHWSYLSSDFGLNYENLDIILSATSADRSILSGKVYKSITNRFYGSANSNLERLLQKIE